MRQFIKDSSVWISRLHLYYLYMACIKNSIQPSSTYMYNCNVVCQMWLVMRRNYIIAICSFSSATLAPFVVVHFDTCLID